MNHIGLRLGCFGLVLVLGSCSTTAFKPRRIESRGFLGDYSRLSASGGAGLERSYRAPGFDGRDEPMVFIDSPSFWRPIDVPVLDVAEADLERLARILHDAAEAALAPDFKIVRALEPGVLRLRLAFTEPTDTWVVFQPFGAHLPPELLAAESDRVPPTMTALLARATIEVRVSVSGTDNVELAASGRIPLGRSEESVADWGAVKNSLQRWSEKLRATLRGNDS